MLSVSLSGEARAKEEGKANTCVDQIQNDKGLSTEELTNIQHDAKEWKILANDVKLTHKLT